MKKLVWKIMLDTARLFFGLKNIIAFKPHPYFAGNVYALYNYLKENEYDKKYEFIWHTTFENEAVHENVKIFSKETFLKRLYYLACTKYVFYEDGCPVIHRTKGQVVLYLTHGCPAIKDVTGLLDVSQKKTTHSLSTADGVTPIMSKIEKIPEKNFFVCGHPRNDVIFNSPLKYDNIINREYEKIIFWLPTFRKLKVVDGHEGRVDCDKKCLYGLPLITDENDLDIINKTLSEKKIVLVIKPHPGALKEGIENINYSNILVWSQEYLDKNNINYYRLFKNTDAFISDYSSVIFDAMLADKPLAYVIDDIDDYKLGYALDNVLDYMPGHHIKTLEDMIEFLEDISQGKDVYKEERHQVNNWANKYQDGNNCERIVKLLNL